MSSTNSMIASTLVQGYEADPEEAARKKKRAEQLDFEKSRGQFLRQVTPPPTILTEQAAGSKTVLGG